MLNIRPMPTLTPHTGSATQMFLVNEKATRVTPFTTSAPSATTEKDQSLRSGPASRPNRTTPALPAENRKPISAPVADRRSLAKTTSCE